MFNITIFSDFSIFQHLLSYFTLFGHGFNLLSVILKRILDITNKSDSFHF